MINGLFGCMHGGVLFSMGTFKEQPNNLCIAELATFQHGAFVGANSKTVTVAGAFNLRGAKGQNLQMIRIMLW